MGNLQQVKEKRSKRETMKLALFFGFAQASETCPTGTSTGINMSGKLRPKNEHICFPTCRGARVTSCNDMEGKIEMTAVLQGNFLTNAPQSFHKLGDNFYMAKFKANELQVKYTS